MARSVKEKVFFFVDFNSVFFALKAFHKEINMSARKKDGGTNWKHYEAQDTIEMFEPVRQYLIKNHKKVTTFFVLGH